MAVERESVVIPERSEGARAWSLGHTGQLVCSIFVCEVLHFVQDDLRGLFRQCL